MGDMRTGAGFARLRSVLGIASCIIGLAVVYFGFGTSMEAPKQEANASAPSSAPAPLPKPVQAMNLALGNMVFLAQDLGFSVKTAKDSRFDASKVALRIEKHLQRLREIYRQENGKNPHLVGTVSLQFNVSAAGEVSQVKELWSRINDSVFKDVIIGEVAKWSFADNVAENLTVTCPLLFVHEGMDITTLVLWEKSLRDTGEKPAATRMSANAIAAIGDKTEPLNAAKMTAQEFQIKYQTSLRQGPHFTSTALTSFAVGTKVTVLRRSGDWLEVRAGATGPTGFIRKEFVKPMEVAAQ